jgi:predicted nucleic acid-binding protein
MARRTEAYVDTSAFIAFLDRSDSHHPVFKRLFGRPPKLVTSALVVAEGHGWFLRRYDRQRALQFLNFLEQLPMLTVQSFDKAERERTTVLVRKFADQNLTLADAHGLATVQQFSLSTCWSTDRHLGLTGAILVV